MVLSKQIAYYRKSKNITQDELARQLGITNQAVSKWETDQSCPDVELLPKLADIFEITIDELFERKPEKTENQENASCKNSDLPWEDDETLRAVMYIGHRMVQRDELGKNVANICKEITFEYCGLALNVESYFNVSCENVASNVTAGGYVECGDVGGQMTAGSYVECGDVTGNIAAGSYVECGNVSDSIAAGSYVECGNVGKNVAAGSYVECRDVQGTVSAGGNIECADVLGNVSAGGDVQCGDIQGDVKAEGNIECGDIGGNVYQK